MKKLGFVLLVIFILLLIGELTARFLLGLGDPPLSIGDGKIDYLFAPSQKCHRFGNYIVYNEFSMRCHFSLKGTNPRQRIFVVGDSVVNGGVLTDHKDLATTILQNKLDFTHADIQVLNVSAGSWGPGNYAMYFNKYSELVRSNDVVIVEVNSHDLWEDDPVKTAGANVGKDIALPVKKPCSALMECVNRYLIPRVKNLFGMVAVNTKVDVPKWGNDGSSASASYNLEMLNRLYSFPWVKRYMLIYRSRKECKNNTVTEGERIFREFAKTNGVVIIDAQLDAQMDYRDSIHPNQSGQRKLSEAIIQALGY